MSVALWGVYLVGLRVAVAPPESCGAAKQGALEEAAREAVGWMERNQRPDGAFLYIYLAETDTVLVEYNEVRHAGVTMALYQAAGRLGDAEALTAADRGLGWMQSRLVRSNGWAALDSGGEPKLGAAALLTVGLTERRAVTEDSSYDGLMRELGRFMLALQRPDGGFYLGWRVATDTPIEGQSKYYPGEAFWALTLLDKAFPGEGWRVAAEKAADWLVTRRDDEMDVDWPPLPDQWTAYGLAELADTGLSGRQADYARRLAGRWGFFTRIESQRQAGWMGRFVRGREARAAGLGTWVEGLAALWRAAMKDARLADIREPLRERARCAARILAARQVGEQQSETYPRRDLVRGAWIRGGETRMDDQQHAFSGLTYTVDALTGRVQRAPDAPVATP